MRGALKTPARLKHRFKASVPNYVRRDEEFCFWIGGVPRTVRSLMGFQKMFQLVNQYNKLKTKLLAIKTKQNSFVIQNVLFYLLRFIDTLV